MLISSRKMNEFVMGRSVSLEMAIFSPRIVHSFPASGSIW